MKTPMLKDELKILVKISLCLCLFQFLFLDRRSEIPNKRPLTTLWWDGSLSFPFYTPRHKVYLMAIECEWENLFLFIQ